MSDRPILLLSNRGPISFRREDDGGLRAVRGAGGLVSGLSPLLAGTDRRWLAAALTDDDRAAVREAATSDPADDDATPGYVEVTADGVGAYLADIDPVDLDHAYETVCNRTLWYLHHHLFDLARTPTFDESWRTAWAAYRRVNHAFAELAAELAPPDAAVLVQDYHLCLVAPRLTERRPDLRVVHFSHTPFATPDVFAVLPDEARLELLEGLAAHTACGFHSPRWQRSFLDCCARDGVSPPPTFVAPLGPDRDDLAATAASDACHTAAEALERKLAGRRCIVRVDRIELSKNIVRGFAAFDELLERHPEWRGQVCFAAHVYPSREANPDYAAYRAEVDALVARVNERWATPGWTPILFDSSDDFPASVAALTRADVVLVNPVRDGLNLVAKESMLVNERDGLLALSPEAGAWDELGPVARAVHPFDLVQTADALHELLSLDADDRARLAVRLRAVAAQRTPADWLADQLTAAE